MYNGQYIKALAHVLIFAVFVSLSDKSFVFALLLAAWVFYQVFDAAQTAKARRDGLPLPNPFGLNDLGSRLGMAPTPGAAPYVAGFSPGAAPGGSAAAPDRGRVPIPHQTPAGFRPAASLYLVLWRASTTAPTAGLPAKPTVRRSMARPGPSNPRNTNIRWAPWC